MSNPPSDITSQEYREWYEEFCKVYYSQPTSENQDGVEKTSANKTLTETSDPTSDDYQKHFNDYFYGRREDDDDAPDVKPTASKENKKKTDKKTEKGAGTENDQAQKRKASEPGYRNFVS